MQSFGCHRDGHAHGEAHFAVVDPFSMERCRQIGSEKRGLKHEEPEEKLDDKCTIAMMRPQVEFPCC